MVKEIIKTDIEQIVEIEEYCFVAEYSIERIIEIALVLIRTIGMILGTFGGNLRTNQNYRGQNYRGWIQKKL